MKITEIVVWKEIPPSAILAHWSWSKITNPMLTGWDEGWLPGLCGYDKVTELREYLLSRSTMQSEQDEWAVLGLLDAVLPLDWRNDGRKLEFFLHLAVKMLGYKRGLGVKTESDCRHAWPEGLGRVAVMMRLAEEMEKLWRQEDTWLAPPSKRPPGIQLDQSASHLERFRRTI